MSKYVDDALAFVWYSKIDICFTWLWFARAAHLLVIICFCYRLLLFALAQWAYHTEPQAQKPGAGLRMGSREEPRQRAHSGRLLFRRRSHFQRMFMSLDGSMIGRRLLAARTASTTGSFAKCMRQMTLVAPARCAPALQ